MGAKKEIKRLEEWERHLELVLAMVRIKLHRQRALQQVRREGMGLKRPAEVHFVEVTEAKVAGQSERSLC